MMMVVDIIILLLLW